MSLRTLNLGELNRTLLARQLLLGRSDLDAAAVIERLVGLQAQLARPPYIGLWTRLAHFARADLASLIEQRSVVKATFLRATLHLLTAADYATFRATLQPVLTSALDAIVKQRAATIDVPGVVDAARALLDGQPRSFAEITEHLTARAPDVDPGAMRYAVRTHLPLVQVPVRTGWSYPGNPRFALAHAWLDQPLDDQVHLEELVRRYLTAFGPASVNDVHTWSYLPVGDLQPTFDRLAPELERYQDPRGRALYDLARLSIVAAEHPAPIRFLPEFDNLLLAHQNRTRVVPEAYRSKVYLPGLRIAATVLVDGFVAGTWSTQRQAKNATLLVAPFESLAPTTLAELSQEGERLLRFAEPEARTFTLRIAD